MAPRSVHVGEVKGLVGQEIGVSDWIEVDQGMIDTFADLTDDHQWIHVDVERANREIGGPIAHGFLTLSLMPRLSHQIMKLEGVARSLNYGFERIRFTNPVPAGRRIRMRVSIKSAEDKNGGLLITRECVVEVEGADRPAIIAEWLGLAFPLETAAA